MTSPTQQVTDDFSIALQLKDAKKKKGTKKGSRKRDVSSPSTSTTQLEEDAAAAPPAFKTSSTHEDEPPTTSAEGHFQSQHEHLTATGILLSHDRSKDVQIDQFSVAAYGQQLVRDTQLTLLYGHRYGLVGQNGCGKSTLLRALARREVPIPASLQLHLLEREYDATPLTAVEAVVELVQTERDALETELEELLSTQEGASSARADAVQDRLQELDLGGAEQKARSVLHGLGFTEAMQDQATSEFSGGWRMRVALARALFVKPTLLLLDDATNHLDLSAVVWLEEYLLHYPHTVVMVSHSQDFINSICTDILALDHCKLENYTGNHDNYLKVKAEQDENARKRAKADGKKLQKIKENLGRSGVQAKQAKSHEKAMQKRQEKDGSAMTEEDLSRLLLPPKKLEFNFQQCGGGLASPFIKFNNVSYVLSW